MATRDESPQCDCGYVCEGETVDERVRDGQRHAREVHGIEVSVDQVLDQRATP
jgi:predicted small metal-binding protein